MLFNNFYKTTYDFNWKVLEPILEKMVNIKNQDHLEKGDALTSFKNKISVDFLKSMSKISLLKFQSIILQVS